MADFMKNLSPELVQSLSYLKPDQITAILNGATTRTARVNAFLAKMKDYIDRYMTDTNRVYSINTQFTDMVVQKFKSMGATNTCIEYSDVHIIIETVIDKLHTGYMKITGDQLSFKWNVYEKSEWDNDNKNFIRMFGSGGPFIYHPDLRNVKFLDPTMRDIYNSVMKYEENIRKFFVPNGEQEKNPVPQSSKELDQIQAKLDSRSYTKEQLLQIPHKVYIFGTLVCFLDDRNTNIRYFALLENKVWKRFPRFCAKHPEWKKLFTLDKKTENIYVPVNSIVEDWLIERRKEEEVKLLMV